jgi:steroid 5-alpha reductase family enzyme
MNAAAICVCLWSDERPLKLLDFFGIALWLTGFMIEIESDK